MAGTVEDYLGRMDIMNQTVNPMLSHQQILGDLLANLELLYIKAKNYHWNVSGVGFQGVHETFDKVQDYAVDQGDRVAERMRYYGYPVVSTATDFLQRSWFSEGNCSYDQTAMLHDMSMSLQVIHDKIIDRMDLIPCPVSQNMTQDICEGLDKFNYFIKSNLPEYARPTM